MTSMIITGFNGVTIELHKTREAAQRGLNNGMEEVIGRGYDNLDQIGVTFPKDPSATSTAKIIVFIYISPQLTGGKPEVLARTVAAALKPFSKNRKVEVNIIHPAFTL